MFDDLVKPASTDVLKVSELTNLIKAQLEQNFRRIWVQGEISNLRRQSSGHVYFSLKDSGSQLPCVLFGRDASKQSFELRDGQEVLLFGDLSLFAPHGRYQLIARIAIESGQGRLQVQFEKLKRKLHAEGLFDKALKQALPAFPQRIAVITSPSGAAIRDFLRILSRLGFGGSIVIFPARVQGAEAAKEITSMIEYAGASRKFDLVVLTRGGGSIEDLWPFNEEVTARAVAACTLPIISAVGHEIDTVLTDYAADVRAETPSAAAELIASLYLEIRQRFETASENLQEGLRNQLDACRQSLHELHSRLRIIAPEKQIQLQSMQLDDFENRLAQSLQRVLTREDQRVNRLNQALQEHHPRHRLDLAAQSFKDLDRRLDRTITQQRRSQTERLQALENRLQNSSLQATLKRGYAVLKKTDGTLLSTAAEARKERCMHIDLQDGSLEVRQAEKNHQSN